MLRSSKTQIKNIAELVGVLTGIGCYVVQDNSGMFKVYNPEHGRYPNNVIIAPNLDVNGYGPFWYKDDSVLERDRVEYEHLIEKIDKFDMKSLDVSKYGLIFNNNKEGVDFLHESDYDSSKDFGEVNDFMFTHRDVDVILPNKRYKLLYPNVDSSVKPMAVGMFYDGALAFINGFHPIREEVDPVISGHHRILREAYAERFFK